MQSGHKQSENHYPSKQRNEKMIEGNKIDSIRIEPDLIDLTKLSHPDSMLLYFRLLYRFKFKKRWFETNSPYYGVDKSEKAPEEMKQESEKKQKTMLSTLDQKKKELQKQKDAIEKLNQELQQLDVPVTKEIATLRTKIEAVDRELAKATKIRKQKEMELLQAINTVTQLADEKCSLKERLKAIMYDFEASKQKKLEQLEGELKQLKVYSV